MDRSIDFASNMDVGTPEAPVKMNFGVEFNITLPVGWSWFSVNKVLDNMTLGFILSSVNSNGDYIKSQTATATYYSGFGWFGSLTLLDPKKLYKIRVQNSSSLEFSGRIVDVSINQIAVSSGWNWIGYLPQGIQPINTALSSLTLANYDYIKNQTNSATYYSGYGWFGTLNNLSPSQGYMLRLTNAGTLTYPESGKKGSQILLETEQLQFDPHKFEFSGSITAKVMVDGVAKGAAKDSLYAYVNNEIRGVTSGLYFTPTQSWLFNLMIYSNISQGESVSFRYYNAENKKYYVCNETVTFSSDMVMADAIKPFVLHSKATGVNDWGYIDGGASMSVYPNPFEDHLNIEYNLNESSHVRITVFDTYGRVINSLVDQKQEPGNYSLKWDSGLPQDGIYFIKLEAGQRQKIQRVILMR